jgi:hypothetical protein
MHVCKCSRDNIIQFTDKVFINICLDLRNFHCYFSLCLIMKILCYRWTGFEASWSMFHSKWTCRCELLVLQSVTLILGIGETLMLVLCYLLRAGNGTLKFSGTMNLCPAVMCSWMMAICKFYDEVDRKNAYWVQLLLFCTNSLQSYCVQQMFTEWCPAVMLGRWIDFHNWVEEGGELLFSWARLAVGMKTQVFCLAFLVLKEWGASFICCVLGGLFIHSFIHSFIHQSFRSLSYDRSIASSEAGLLSTSRIIYFT